MSPGERTKRVERNALELLTIYQRRHNQLHLHPDTQAYWNWRGAGLNGCLRHAPPWGKETLSSSDQKDVSYAHAHCPQLRL
jgi:hypothetical protein